MKIASPLFKLNQIVFSAKTSQALIEFIALCFMTCYGEI